jgi:hypothetical protein
MTGDLWEVIRQNIVYLVWIIRWQKSVWSNVTRGAIMPESRTRMWINKKSDKNRSLRFVDRFSHDFASCNEPPQRFHFFLIFIVLRIEK